MPDEVDDLILKMQHLEAAARASEEARAKQGRFASLKTRAQKMAVEAQLEVEAAQKQQADAEARLSRARQPGLPPLQAAELLESGRTLLSESKTRLVKSRARLNFALDQMDEAERNDWEALQAAARAEAHTQLAESGDDSSQIPVLSPPPLAAISPATPAPTAASGAAPGPAADGSGSGPA